LRLFWDVRVATDSLWSPAEAAACCLLGGREGLGSRQQVSDEVRGLGSCNWERNAGKFPAKELPLNRLNRQLRSEANAFGLLAFHAKAVGASRCVVNVIESNKL